MKAYFGTFTKKDGSIRDMSFVRLEDINNYNPEFLASRIVGNRTKSNNYSEGNELVYDLEADAFRIFNHSTLVNSIKEYIIDDSLFS